MSRNNDCLIVSAVLAEIGMCKYPAQSFQYSDWRDEMGKRPHQIEEVHGEQTMQMGSRERNTNLRAPGRPVTRIEKQAGGRRKLVASA